VRHLLPLVSLFALATAAFGQTAPKPGDKPGVIVFEPKKPTTPNTAAEPGTPGRITVLKGSDPKFPGFIVFAPNKAEASKLLPAPTGTSRVETTDGVPTITIIGKGAKDPPATDPAKPVPGGAKPAQPEPEKVEDGKILLETYDSAYCRGCKVGYLHTLVREYDRNGKKVLYGTKRLTLQIARFGDPVEQWTEESTIETPDGVILRTTRRQGVGKNAMLEMTGVVTDKGLEVSITGAGGNGKETIKWPEGVVGVAKEATLLRDMKPKAGTAIEYQTYFGMFNAVITFKMKVVGTEEVDPLGTGKKQKMVKVIQEMVPVKTEQGEFKQPPITYWLDPTSYEPLALESDMPPLGGVLTAKRTTREVALAKPTKYLDLGEVQSIKLPATVPDIHDKDSMVYVATLGDDLPLDKAFATDARQTVKVLDEKARTVEIRVTAIRKPTKPNVPPLSPGKEYLSDSFYIDWDNDLVKKHAAAAVAGLPANATDWEKAKAVETWVHKNMKQVEFSQAMAACKTVAEKLSGDCTEHAMLATGMCRALGIPAKTSLGLVYAPTRDGGAQLAYHMWFEVYADGGWVALDAILGKGSVGPGHIKIVDAHWDGEKGFTPLLPVLGLLSARPQVKFGK
jgi:hypothetical protein